MGKETQTKISAKNWVLIWVLGFCGQMCWAVENNTFATYALTNTGKSNVVTWMVALSALASTVATFISGTLGDRLGRRKKLINIGFILWGIFTIAFGLADFVPKNPIWILCVYVVFMDAVMSFCGSIGYSGGVNAWTTDISDETNRGSVSGVLSAMVIVANIVVLGLQGMIVQKFGFLALFVTMGIIVLVIGIISLFILEDSETLKPSVTKDKFFAQIFEAFNFKETFKNRELLLMMLTLCVYTAGFNIYMSYMTSYLWIFFPIYSGIDLSKGNASIIQGIGMLLGVALSVFAIKPINKGKTLFVTFLSVIISVVSLIAISFTRNIPCLYIFVTFTSLGYVLCLLATTAWFKNLCPEDKCGQTEGVKQIFFTLIPMSVGPLIASTIIKKINFTTTYDGVVVNSPTNVLFLVAGIATAFTLIPLWFAYRQHKSTKNE